MNLVFSLVLRVPLPMCLEPDEYARPLKQSKSVCMCAVVLGDGRGSRGEQEQGAGDGALTGPGSGVGASHAKSIRSLQVSGQTSSCLRSQDDRRATSAPIKSARKCI